MKAPVGSGGFRPTSAFISGLFWPWNDPLLQLLWTQRCTLIYFFFNHLEKCLFEICVQRFMFSLVFSRWFYMGINHNLLMPPGICFFNFHFWVTLFVSHLKYMGHFWVIVNFEPTDAKSAKWTQWCRCLKIKTSIFLWTLIC